jgi:hypothetical protein
MTAQKANKKTNVFIVVWDCIGLEYVGNVTADEQARTWAALKSEPYASSLPSLNALILRARYNSQRHYEIYAVSAVDGISAEDIREMFEASPQTAADTIRRLGERIYSD